MTGHSAETIITKADAQGEEAFPAAYDFHGLFTVLVAHRGLHALMKRELGMFLSDVDTSDLRVEEGDIADPDRRLAVRYGFGESRFVLDIPGGKVELSDGVLRAEPGVSPQELLIKWVENFMRHRALQQGVSLVHSSAVSRDGMGYVFPAWAHAGKTNVLLSYLSEGYAYMADDWCFVSSTGEILAYPRWLNIFDYNFETFPQLIEKAGSPRWQRKIRRALKATRYGQSLEGTSKLLKGLRRRLLDRYFVYTRMPVSRAFPGCGTALRASLSKVCLLEVSRASKGEISEAPAEDLARKVALANSYERSRYRMHQLAIAYAGVENVMGDTVHAETELLTSAFERARCFMVTLPSRLSQRALDLIRRKLEEA